MNTNMPVAKTAVCAVFALIVACTGTSKFRYVKVPEKLPECRTDNFSEEERAIEEELQKCAAIPECVSYFKEYFNAVFLMVDGFDRLGFTYFVKDGKGKIVRGYDSAAHPVLTITLNEQNCHALYTIFEDGKVTDEENYRIFRVTLLPSIRSALQMDALYDPVVARRLAFPNFIQLTLKNEQGYVYRNSAAVLTLSLVNVDGQWLVFEGDRGDPDIRYAFDHKQAGTFRKLVYKFTLEKDAPLETRKKNLATLKSFLEGVIVYKR